MQSNIKMNDNKRTQVFFLNVIFSGHLWFRPVVLVVSSRASHSSTTAVHRHRSSGVQPFLHCPHQDGQSAV